LPSLALPGSPATGAAASGFVEDVFNAEHPDKTNEAKQTGVRRTKTFPIFIHHTSVLVLNPAGPTAKLLQPTTLLVGMQQRFP
jgi:hypothetical protein